MEPIKAPKTLKIYALLKQNGMSFSPASTLSSSATSIGTGYFTTLQEAEHYRTLELLKASATKEKFHIFELEVPNPTYEESKE